MRIKIPVVIYIIFSLSFLVYMAWPLKVFSINQFSALPDSAKSTLSGDTIEVPNLVAYFSNNYRRVVIPFYINNFSNLESMPIKPMRINYPPEYAFTVIKIQTHSTYLEELTYPLRNSLYVNGLEPVDEFTKMRRYLAESELSQDSKTFETKVTLRYYPSSFWTRMLVWLGIILLIPLIYLLGRRIVYNE